MYRFLILISFFVLSNASSILNISYFPLSNKMDILFSLDKPFNGKVIFLSKNSYKITNVTLNRIEQKKINDSLDITISPLDENSVNLKLNYKKILTIKPSVTTKGYGLRIRILGLDNKTSSSTLIKNLDNQPTNNLSQNIKKDDESGFNYVNYILVILILLFLIAILIYVKKKAIEKLPSALQKKDSYKILYQKMIDPKNKIIMIEVFEKRYLLLLGDKNNLLLDNFSQQTQDELQDISTQNEFGKLLDEKLDEDTTMNFLKNATKLKEDNEL